MRTIATFFIALVAMVGMGAPALAGTTPCNETVSIAGDHGSGINFVCSKRFNAKASGRYSGGSLHLFIDRRGRAIVRLVVKRADADDSWWRKWATGAASDVMFDYACGGQCRYGKKPGNDESWFDIGEHRTMVLGSEHQLSVWRIEPTINGHKRTVHIATMRIPKEGEDILVLVWLGSQGVYVGNDQAAEAALRQLHVNGSIAELGRPERVAPGEGFQEQVADHGPAKDRSN
ncbi:MAG: hypothetical protein QF858_03965 [Candidatus Pacebacteria bacterium]|jgi:hypothetical protein|nr:hypothetical protein [Candidatus Paceibacterota bacterium]MDP6659744.1 hypothetical protein [Candidatus Paceibacterota bacterium]